MLQYNTMRYGTDEFSFSKQGLLIAKTPFDAAGQTSVEGFAIDGGQSVGTDRKVLFKVDGDIVKFNGQELVTVGGGETFDNVNANGNTVEELIAVESIPAWLGKKIYPLVALSAPADSNVLPSIKLGLKVRSDTDVYEQITESAVVTLTNSEGDAPRIADIEVIGSTTGNGSYTVTARLQTGGGWSDYVPVQNIRDADAQAIQFKIRYNVNVIGGGDSAKVSRIVVHYTGGTSTVAGDIAEIYSVMRDYEYPLGICAVTVKHKHLIDSQIKAFVNFAKQPKTRTFMPLGVSDGTRQKFILGVDGERDTGIVQSSIQVFADGQRQLVFNYNTEVSELELQIDSGKSLSVSYEYEREAENWREMPIDVDQEPYDDGTFLTRFTYALPDEELDNQTVTNVRIQLVRTSGTVDAEILGTATGHTQQFVLAHAAKAETLTLNADFSYDEDSQVVTCVAPAGTEIRAAYDWIGESHTVYSWAAAWSPAI